MHIRRQYGSQALLLCAYAVLMTASHAQSPVVFIVEPWAVSAGQPVRICWNAPQARGRWLDPGARWLPDSQGCIDETPVQNTRYALVIEEYTGQRWAYVRDVVVVQVGQGAPPPIGSGAPPPNAPLAPSIYATWRHILLRGRSEQTGGQRFGLHSYLLLTPGSRDDVTRALLQAVFGDDLIFDLERNRNLDTRTENINLLHIPAKQMPVAGSEAATFRSWYDYPRAQIALGALGMGDRVGPYLVTVQEPLQGSVPARLYLVVDLSTTYAPLAYNWLQYFKTQVQRPEPLKEDKLRNSAMHLRDWVQQEGDRIPAIVSQGKPAVMMYQPRAPQ